MAKLARCNGKQSVDKYLPHQLEDGKTYVVLDDAPNGNPNFVQIKIKAVQEGFDNKAIFSSNRFNFLG